jgi:uncharacterized protein YecE (DUF72 family)
MAQLDLFGRPGSPPLRRGVGPAAHPDDVVELGRRLPADVRLGTSSWSFPGWRGLVYDREATPAALARTGLGAYAAHPLLRAVGLDRTFYAPITTEAFAALRAQVPAPFRFLVKALETATVAVFPRHARYGAQAGQANPRFLDPRAVTTDLVRPAVDGLGPALGPIVFQLPPQSPAALGDPGRFAIRLRAFLRGLPTGPCYAVELRNRELAGPDVARALADCGAVPCLTVHPTMPPVEVQARELAVTSDGPLVVRWMLQGDQEYEAARERYAPFDRLVDPDPTTRTAIADLVRAAHRASRASWIVVNNKAEGSAPASIVALARELTR